MQIVKTDPCRSSERRVQAGWLVPVGKPDHSDPPARGRGVQVRRERRVGDEEHRRRDQRRHALPETTEAEQRYLTHPLLDLAKETARFEILTLVLGYWCPNPSGNA
jgi:hypothetical protein